MLGAYKKWISETINISVLRLVGHNWENSLTRFLHTCEMVKCYVKADLD